MTPAAQTSSAPARHALVPDGLTGVLVGPGRDGTEDPPGGASPAGAVVREGE
jgi:hypothetical protein